MFCSMFLFVVIETNIKKCCYRRGGSEGSNVATTAGGAAQLASSDGSSDTGRATAAPAREQFVIHLGSQLKNTYNVELVSGDVLDVTQRSAAAAARTARPTASLYSDSLRAMLLLVDPHVKFNSKQCQGSKTTTFSVHTVYFQIFFCEFISYFFKIVV